VFQTDPILWLQAAAAPWLTSFMVLVSQIGAGRIYRAVAIAIIFGVQLRAGLLLLHLLLASYLLSGVLKAIFALPRPVAVDPRVKDFLGIMVNRASCLGPGPAHFWSPLGAELLARCRALPQLSLGFPSSHLTGATSFFGSGALYFRHRGLLLLGAVMVPLVSLSRMYLGAHFLADAVGGVLIGGIGLGTAVVLKGRERFAAAALLGFAIVVLLAQPGLSFGAGRLAGAVGSTLVLVRRGLPSDGGTLAVRAARVGLAFALYFGTAKLLSLIAKAVGMATSPWTDFVFGVLPISLCLLGTVWLGQRFRLFGQGVAPSLAGLP
jgi:membrane-associated phospholipid phosphatase